ncbi:metallophosphoesterase [Shewanella benthica]|nr:metallophosphoesterase [Shewanella benthica]
MEKPKLILRFRNATPGIDTIREHQKIINGKTSVLWGWWKKELEPEQAHLFDVGRGRAYVIDPSQHKLYIVTYVRSFLGAKPISDISLIPEYYRGSTDKVAGWFELSYIEEVEYDQEVELIVGQKTLSQVMSPISNSYNMPTERNRDTCKTSVLHLSDLHFGDDHGYKTVGSEKGLGVNMFSDMLLRDIKSIGLYTDIESIIITGDLTTRGDWSEPTRGIILEQIGKIALKLGVKKEHIFIAPGNHDIIRYKEDDRRDITEINVELQTNQEHETKLRLFIEDLTGRHWKKDLDYLKVLSLKDVDVNIFILNSCRVAAEGKWTEYGFVGYAGLQTLEKVKSQECSIKTYSIMALHHHLLPVNRVDMLNEKGVSLTIDAIQLLDKASEVGVSIALHGHQHCSRVARYQKLKYEHEEKSPEPITIISAGSGGVDKSRRADSMRNSYSVITFTEESAKLTMREISNDSVLQNYLYKGVSLTD